MNITRSFPDLLQNDLGNALDINDDSTCECVSFSASSLSGLSGYEEELQDLKSSLKSPSHHRSVAYNETRLDATNKELKEYKINSELQLAKTSNELLNLKWKLELEFHDKFEKLLKHNAQLKGELQVAKKHVSSLLDNNALSKDDAYKLVQLGLQNSTLENQIRHWKNEAGMLENANSRLKVDLEEARINLSNKNESIEGLKVKIVDFHIKTQNLCQENIRVNNIIASNSVHLEMLKKSQTWYKEELYKCRHEKFKLLENVSQLQILLSGKQHDLNRIGMDLASLRSMYEQSNLEAFAEKQRLLKAIDKMKCETSVDISTDTLSDDYQLTIESLTKELTVIKQSINEQREAFKTVSKQNSDLITRNIILQKSLNDREISITNIECRKNDLERKLAICTEKEKQNEQLLFNLANEKRKLEIALNRTENEKSEIQDAIKLIKENFRKFTNKYTELKDELHKVKQECFEKDGRIDSIDIKLHNQLELEAKLIKLNEDCKRDGCVIADLKRELCRKSASLIELKSKMDDSQKRIDTFIKELHLKDDAITSLKEEIRSLNCELSSVDRINSRLENPTQLNRALKTENVESSEKVAQFIHTINGFNRFDSNSKCDYNDEIKHLKASLKAKDLEIKEKQKRYQTNNRTLLRKVKEHMRGRNRAEKQCKYLQELFHCAAGESNSYKLLNGSKDGAIQSLQSFCENHKSISELLNKESLTLQTETSIVDAKDCLDNYESLKDRCDYIEKKLRISEETIKEKDLINSELHIKVQELQLKNTKVAFEIKAYTEVINRLNSEILELSSNLRTLKYESDNDKKRIQEYQEDSLRQQNELSNFIMQVNKLEQLHQHVEDKNNLLVGEIESLNNELECHKCELNELKEQKLTQEKEWESKHDDLQKLTMKQQAEMHILQNELVTAQSDKYFFQRLSKDLKIALQTCTIQNGVLKKRLQTLSMEKECSSLPDSLINLPSPSKYNEVQIHELLKKSSASLMEKPRGDLQSCLNSLKLEMACLRNLVAEGIVKR